MKQAYAALVLMLTTSAWLHADDWPQFRGPNGQGRSAEKGVPVEWSAETVAWKTAIPGESWSSPIVWDERVFVTTATDGGASCRILSLDRTSGEVLWNKEVLRQPTLRKEDRNTYATPTPATDGERVYACFGGGGVVAVDFSGEVVWTNGDYRFYGQHGLASSPILYANMLIMARDGSSEEGDKAVGWQTPWRGAYLVALDAKTGKERWRATRGLSRISHGVPAIWEHDSGVEIISEAGDVLQGFDVQTGERLWSHEVIGEGKVPSATFGQGLVFAAGGWGGKESIKAFRLGGRGDLGESQLVWERRKAVPKVPSMLYVEPNLFAVTDGGIATCMSAATGEVRWQKRIGGSFSASPVFADGRVYFVDDDGTTIVVEAGAEFKVLAKNVLDEHVQASMAVADGRIYLRGAKHLFCIGD